MGAGLAPCSHTLQGTAAARLGPCWTGLRRGRTLLITNTHSVLYTDNGRQYTLLRASLPGLGSLVCVYMEASGKASV